MPPSYVKAYLKRAKNDANDAAAICEAVTRPSMRFVATKSMVDPRIGQTLSGQCTVECSLSIGNRSAESIRASGHQRRTNRPDT
jgi:hypothetical protein